MAFEAVGRLASSMLGHLWVSARLFVSSYAISGRVEHAVHLRTEHE